MAEKQNAKYDLQQEAEAKLWVESVTGKKLDGDFFDALKDGTVLLLLLNRCSGLNHSVNKSSMPFKQMENIGLFLSGAEKLGVPKGDLFQTVDLFERKNLGQVVQGIFAFSRVAAKKNPSIPLLGPKLSDRHNPNFDPALLKAGVNVPSQQTGFAAAQMAKERGATQAGLNYGLGRQIVSGNIGSSSDVPSQQTGFAAAKLAQERGATQSGMNYGLSRQIVNGSVSASATHEIPQQSGYQAAMAAKEAGATQSGINFGQRRQIL